MKLYPTVSLAAIAFVSLIGPALAGAPTPGPVAGIGLPAIAVIGGAYWVGRKLLTPKK
jgi:hypothetical protein